MEKKELVGMYRKMLEIRILEEKVYDLFLHGRLPGFVHLAIGQEAVSVGVCNNLRKEDYITSTHRPHGDLIAKGARLDRMMAELLGRRTGYCKGKAGQMHMASIELGILGANGIVGGGLPIAVGAALSARLRGTDQVTVAFFGEGGSCLGTFHEALNLASIWDLPVVFVCQNNQYAVSTPFRDAKKIPNVYSMASAYGIPGVIVDGNDVLEVHKVAGEAMERARAGGGPTLIECKTYRWMGHNVGDAHTLYRSAEEVAEWKKKDPIARFKVALIEEGVMTREEAQAIEEGTRRTLEEAMEFAERSPEPGPEEALQDLYAE